MPGGPRKITFLCSSEEVELGEVQDGLALQRAREAKVEVVERLHLAGKRAALTRASPPWLSRAATSSPSTAARYSS